MQLLIKGVVIFFKGFLKLGLEKGEGYKKCIRLLLILNIIRSNPMKERQLCL